MSQKLSEAKGDMKDPEPHLVHSLGSAASVVHEPDLDKPLSERRYRGKAVADWSAQIPQSPLPAPNSYLDDCMVHDFSISHGEIGNGSFGTVTQVSCRDCNLIAACKTIRLKSREGDLKAKGKRERAMQAELGILGGLRHPNILTFVAHEQSEGGLLRLYTEFCQYKDLEHQYDRYKTHQCEEFAEIFKENGLWAILRQISSALAKCHHGLNAKLSSEGMEEFYSFDEVCKPVIHRDIKSSNILLTAASRSSSGQDDSSNSSSTSYGDTIIFKLADFGAACFFEKGTTRSSWVGTREFWAPEIRKQAEDQDGDRRITAWSTKSDIWSVGVVLYNYLCQRLPSPKELPQCLEERIRKTTKLYCSLRPGTNEEDVPDLLIKLVCECLDEKPENRVTALDILAVSLKTDPSEQGVHRSESFWRTLASRPPDQMGVAATTVQHFVAGYLETMDDADFSDVEANFILSLQSMYTPSSIMTTATLFNQRLSNKPARRNIYHAIATSTAGDAQLEKLVWEDTKWPELSGLLPLSLRRDAEDYFPSTLALPNVHVFRALLRIEDTARKEKEERAVQNAKKETREMTKKETQGEVEFLFNLMAQGRFQMLSMGRKEIQQAFVTAASCNYVATVRKLVQLGVDVSARIGRRRETALHFAAYFGDTALIDFLCMNGAPIEAHDNHRRAPLHCAAWEGHHDAVRVLLSRGADINTQDDAGRTALFGAASGGYMETVRALLGRGADANIRGGTKVQTALDRAEARGHAEIAHELRTRTSPPGEAVAVRTNRRS